MVGTHTLSGARIRSFGASTLISFSPGTDTITLLALDSTRPSVSWLRVADIKRAPLFGRKWPTFPEHFGRDGTATHGWTGGGAVALTARAWNASVGEMKGRRNGAYSLDCGCRSSGHITLATHHASPNMNSFPIILAWSVNGTGNHNGSGAGIVVFP